MNHKSKIITSAATAFGLAVGTAGIIGYRNIDDQWQEFDDSKKQVQQEQSRAQEAIDMRNADIGQREEIADKKLAEAKRLLELSKRTERTAIEDIALAKKQITNAKLAQKEAENSEQEHLEAHRATELVQKKTRTALAEYLKARENMEKELAESKRLQVSLEKEIQLTIVAEAKAKKAASTTVWYQKKAKKQIAQAEHDIATAKKSRQKSLAAQREANRVFHKIDDLEDSLEKAISDAEALAKHNHKLKCELRDLDSDFHSLERKFRKLKKLNADHCATINKQKSIISRHDGKYRALNRLLDCEKAESKKYQSEAKKQKSNALSYRTNAIKYQKDAQNYLGQLKTKISIVNKQRDKIRKLEQELKKKK